MALKLEEILKAEGYTDADLATVAPLLNDPKMRGALDKQFGALEAQLSDFREENRRWDEYNQKVVKPLQEERVNLVANTSSLEARLRLAEQEGFTKRPDAPNPTTTTTEAAKPWNAKEHNVPTWDDVNKVAQMEGEAIALSHDLGAEYKRLTGNDLVDYTSQPDSDGRTRRGMVALLAEAREAKTPLDRYVSQKFDFPAKRAAAAEKAKTDHEAQIRLDERNKVLSESLNPNTRQMMPSQNPFIPQSDRKGPDGKTVQPWDIPAAERRSNRLTHAMQTQYKTGVN